MKRIVIAGGGTGGHVIPALSIAHSLKKKDPTVKIDFIGTARGIEARLVPKENFPVHFLPVSGLKNTSFLRRIKSLLFLPMAFVKSMGLLIVLRPDIVLGVGGYASGPFLLMAALFGFKTAIWEPNAHPGLTNRLLSRFVGIAFVVFDGSRKFFKTKKVVSIGMPLRSGIVPKPRAAHDKLRVLIFGGSQGARAINNVVSDSVVRGGDWVKSVEIVHQTGPVDFENIKKKYDQVSGLKIDVQPFLYDMEIRYGWADVVFCRGGASTIAEVAAARKAAVIIPFPQATDDHQLKNAESLVIQNAAILVIQKDFTVEKFISLVTEFQKTPGKIEKLEANIQQFHRPNASDEISDYLLQRI